eukprot:TRINITY_DN13034_c0_g1_i1.p1 TRINITY_DN13034_c0_g1~~TRINITY_DN13034_c0_g1_i1.p1  ORF type:complete len:272 (-),score=35.46 TRINITY_DN13034_c0_g1_i1:9-824(-)
MADVIARIRAAKNPYDILGVAPDSSEDDIKRAYRKLALVTHPDKNTSPGSEEAFKAVGKAFSILSDPQKRANFDKYGEEGPPAPRMHRHEAHPDDIYDLFAQMFGADAREFHARARQHHHRRHAQQQQPPPLAAQLLQILPILLFFLVYLLFSFGYSEKPPAFSLSFDQMNGYVAKRTTKEHKIPYFVPSSFATEVARDKEALRKIEDSVYDSYKHFLHRKCKFEQQEKYLMKQRALLYYSGKKQKEMLNNAEQYATASCDQLQDYLTRFG